MVDILIEFYDLFMINIGEPIYEALVNAWRLEICFDFIGEFLYYIYTVFCRRDIIMSLDEFREEFLIIGDFDRLQLLLSNIITIIVMIIVIKWVLRMITSPFRYMSNGGGLNDEKITYESKRKGKKTKRKGTN